MSNPPALPYATPAAISPEQLRQLADAQKGRTKIFRAVSVATFSGWTTAIFAAITFICSLSSVPALLLGAGMGVVSYFEFRGASEMRKLDATAPRRLAINQIAFALFLILYGVYELIKASSSGGSITGDPEVDASIAQNLPQLAQLGYSLESLIYVGVIIAALFGPGLTALYYASRAKWISRYLEETPAWIIDLQKTGLRF